MREGLEEFLKRIEEKPTNETLIDRFMTLMMEEDTFNRIFYLKKLVALLLNSNPYYALKAAALELQEARKDGSNREYELAALRDVESSFLKLGKTENAQLISDEIAKLMATLEKAKPARKTEIRLPNRPNATQLSRPLESVRAPEESPAWEEAEAPPPAAKPPRSLELEDLDYTPRSTAAEDELDILKSTSYIPQLPDAKRGMDPDDDDDAGLFYDPKQISEAELPQRKQAPPARAEPFEAPAPLPLSPPLPLQKQIVPEDLANFASEGEKETGPFKQENTPFEAEDAALFAFPGAAASPGSGVEREFSESDDERTEMLSIEEKLAEAQAKEAVAPTVVPLYAPVAPAAPAMPAASSKPLPPPAAPQMTMPPPAAPLQTMPPPIVLPQPTARTSFALDGPLDEPLEQVFASTWDRAEKEEQGAAARFSQLAQQLTAHLKIEPLPELLKALSGRTPLRREELARAQYVLRQWLRNPGVLAAEEALLDWLFEGLDGTATLQFFRRLQLESEAAYFFGFYLEKLEKAEEHRRALSVIRLRLHAEMGSAWFEQTYPVLQRIWDRLYLEPWAWSPEEGGQAFCARLAGRENPLPAAVLAF